MSMMKMIMTMVNDVDDIRKTEQGGSGCWWHWKKLKGFDMPIAWEAWKNIPKMQKLWRYFSDGDWVKMQMDWCWIFFAAK